MLIDRVVDNSEASGEHQAFNIEGNSYEYETANELYAITTTKYSDAVNENNFLSPRDLVILYENIDLGAKFVHNANEIKNKIPNQYVETVVYNDEPDSDGSDISEIYSHEDLHNIYMVNNESINLLNNMSSFETILCHKYGNVDMKTSNLVNEYDKHFLFNDPYIKEQLKIHGMSQCKYSDSTVIPASLLDYICCRRLEDNYNFYMDNIIKYVQRTIEQLKRISNGDYLTEKAKEKWREVDDLTKTDDYKNTALLNCADIPVLVETKVGGIRSTWDDIVHSEMDVRCLTKILEKKIIVEVSKLLYGTYKLFSRCCNDNLIISCKKNNSLDMHENKDESLLNVVLKLKRSDSGKVTSNINSVMIFESIPHAVTNTETCTNNLTLELMEGMPEKKKTLKIIELDNDSSPINIKPEFSTTYTENYDLYSTAADACGSLSVTTPDELGYTMRRLNIKSPVMEESEDTFSKKKKSPTKVRIKSPYENRSYVIEEKKRKKLLEIREKREKKKIALNESCKVTKPKYGKGAVMAQSSNSVTKLSITNKSFYNSIYGQSVNVDNNSYKKSFKKQNSDDCPEIDCDDEEEYKKESILTPDKNSLKYINHSYYLDDADTEMQNYLQTKSNRNCDMTKITISPSTSTVSNDIGNLNMLKRLITNTSVTDLSGTDTTSSLHQNLLVDVNENNAKDFLKLDHNNEVQVPTNTPKEDDHKIKNYKKIISVECRKSIDKIYDLMKNNDDTETKNLYCIKTKFVNAKVNTTGESCILQGSDSGTSYKHQLTCSNPSINSFEINNSAQLNCKIGSKKKVDKPLTIIPKVIINSKIQAGKMDYRINKVDKKIEPRKLAENPLKAISQLLHDIDNVQKTRYKSGNDLKPSKKSESLSSEGKNTARHLTTKRVNEQVSSRLSQNKDKKLYQNPATDMRNFPTRLPNENPTSKVNKKKIADIIDEVKELKGEAVRGPSKRSRLDSLAQPKKNYVQAHHEEYQSRQGKIFSTEKQKLLINPQLNQEKHPIPIINRHKRASDILTGLPKQTVNNSPVEKSPKSRLLFKGNQDDYPKNYPLLSKGPSINQKNLTPGPLKKKMVAVETYLNNHFGQVSPPLVTADSKKSRAPLIPIDLDIDSITSLPTGEESTTLGKKLHYIINSMMDTSSTPLSAVTECKESTTKSDKSDTETESDQGLTKIDEVISASEYNVDIFEDKNIVTAVACLSKEDQMGNDGIEKDNTNPIVSKNDSHKSDNDLQKLEDALYSQISSGAFNKRLRIKKLTLTPKSSIQQMIILNSGDDSLLVKSTLSQKFSFPMSDIMPDIHLLPILSNSSIKRRFPTQVTTVGYAFPIYQAGVANPKMETTSITQTSCVNKLLFREGTCNKSLQCNMRIDGNLIQNDTTNLTVTKVNTCNIIQDDKFGELKEYIDRDKQNPLTFEKGLTSVEKFRDNEDLVSITENSENISNTTSLDILVGLLNEIKKITSCQANLVKHNSEISSTPINKQVEIILNKSGMQENTPDVSANNSISISSLLSLRQEESVKSDPLCLSPSNRDVDYCEFGKSNKKHKNLSAYRCNCIDKEVTVKISQKELVHTFTDVPSQFLVTTVNNTADVTILKKTSSQSMKSYSACQIAQILKSSSYHKITKFKKVINDNNILPNKLNVKRNKDKHTGVTKESKQNNTRVLTEFDPIMKMKRDILVTVYSILVLTVFAALTFPEIIPLA